MQSGRALGGLFLAQRHLHSNCWRRRAKSSSTFHPHIFPKHAGGFELATTLDSCADIGESNSKNKTLYTRRCCVSVGYTVETTTSLTADPLSPLRHSPAVLMHIHTETKWAGRQEARILSIGTGEPSVVRSAAPSRASACVFTYENARTEKQ